MAIVAVATVLLLLMMTLQSSQPRFWQPGPLVRSESFGDYEVRIYQRDDESFFEKICEKLPAFISDLRYRVPGLKEWSGVEILKNHHLVYCDYGRNLGVAEYGSNSIAGLDITGDGIPKVVLTDNFGRLGGGSLVVFQCGDLFRKIAEIHSVGTYPDLRDLDGDGIPELIVSDEAFYHWPICRDGEPMPEVILRWQNGKYVAAKDLMDKPAPAAEELEAMAAVIRSSPAWDAESWQAPPELWTNAIALMYSGHESLGWRFVDNAWQPGFAGKKEFMINYYLRSRLEQSAYASDIMAVAQPRRSGTNQTTSTAGSNP